jgi:hypothetical protein
MTIDIKRLKPLGWAALAVAMLGTAFQVGHFTEHAIQAGQWLFVSRNHAWMSELACWLSVHMGATMASGMEVLHLTGNLIFLVTIALWIVLDTSGNPWLRRAFAVEAFHLSEHVSLTATVLLYGKAAGWSTLFGFAGAAFGYDGAVGFRVLWHFGMNLVPSLFMLWAMLPRDYGTKAAQAVAPIDPCSCATYVNGYGPPNCH